MLILYSNEYKIHNLKNLIKINNIRNYSNLNKKELLVLLNKTKATTLIQRRYRMKINTESVCPITLCEIKYPFICIKCINKFRYYSLNEFIEYLNRCTNDFIDPFTREPIPTYTINYIEYLIKYYKLTKLQKKKNWNKNLSLRYEYLTITSNLNIVLNEIFKNDNLTLDFIYQKILPQFIYYFHFLLQRHKSNCFTVINNYINCINHHPCQNKIYLIDYLKLIISINNL